MDLARSHAKVWKSDPGIGSTLTQAPTKVTVFALDNLDPDPAKSNLQVYGPGADATDTLISQGNAQVSLSDPKQMTISIMPTSGHVNGVYLVFWKTVSADDGDPAAGAFSFTVNTNGTSAGTTLTQAQKSAAAPASTSTGTPIWVMIAAALAALCIGFGTGLSFGHRRPKMSSFAAMRASVSRATKEEEKRISG